MDQALPRDPLTIETALTYAEAQTSRCRRKSVCAIACRAETGILFAVAYNGPVGDWSCTNEVGRCGCMHAEQRLILDLLRDSRPPSLDLYVTHSPCQTCANLILESNLFRRVVFREVAVHWQDSLEFLRRNMEVVQC